MVEQSGQNDEKNVPMETESSGVKFSFGMKMKRKEEVKLLSAPVEIVSVPVDSDEERELEEHERQAKRRRLTHFEDGGAPRDEDEKKSTVVIPLVIENDWRVAKLLELENEGKATDADRAKLAILTEEKPFQANPDENDVNSIVVNGETKVNADADYSAVPIEDFGLAILRGCGWKDGDGIGRRPQVVPLRLPNRRPKGLGLGATPAKPEKGKKGEKTKEGEEEKEIGKDSTVKITGGRHQGKYGLVESRDDDNNSIFVRLALGGQAVKVSLYVVQAVTKKEYDRDSKCINKGDYDKEKERIDRKREELEGSREKRRERDDKRGKEKSSSSAREGTSREPSSSELWVRPDLMVRFVDDGYKGGRMFNTKMRVVDVASRKEISLEDDSGRIHYGLRQSHMETVIPRNEGERVMIVRGRHAGSVAVMEEKDKRRCTLVARILRNSKVVDIDFDDVCMYKPKHDDDDDC